MIAVINKRDNLESPYKVYIGRPSVLGNIYPVETYGRERCIELFERDLIAAMTEEQIDPDYIKVHLLNYQHLKDMRAEMYRLIEFYREHGQLLLECWCAPDACHGDVIKKYIDKHEVLVAETKEKKNESLSSI